MLSSKTFGHGMPRESFIALRLYCQRLEFGPNNGTLLKLHCTVFSPDDTLFVLKHDIQMCTHIISERCAYLISEMAVELHYLLMEISRSKHERQFIRKRYSSAIQFHSRHCRQSKSGSTTYVNNRWPFTCHSKPTLIGNWSKSRWNKMVKFDELNICCSALLTTWLSVSNNIPHFLLHLCFLKLLKCSLSISMCKLM